MSSLPLQVLVITIAGGMTRERHKVVAYLLAEERGIARAARQQT
jgi:hypothetical protein